MRICSKLSSLIRVKSTNAKLPDYRDLYLVSITYKDEHKAFVFFKKPLQERFPDVNISSVFCNLADADFAKWDPSVFETSISWLRAGHLNPLSHDDHLAKQQVKDYLYLHHIVFRLQLITVQNHIVDVIKARKTCHEGWYNASLVRRVYNVTENGDGLRRFLVDSFVYKSYRQIIRNPTAKAYWSTHRRSVLAENMAAGNTEFVMDQADAVAAVRILDPCTRSACHYHNHDPGVICHLSLKRKREDSMEDFIVSSRRRS